MGNCAGKGKRSKGKNGKNNLRVNGQALPETTPCDHTFRIVIVGDVAVGKTSLLLRFADGTFPEHTESTTIDYKTKVFKIKDKVVKLMIVDTAGQERFRTISSTVYRDAQGIIFAYDVTEEKTFEDFEKQWYLEVEHYAKGCRAKMLVGLKTDLGPRKISEADAAAKAEELHIKYMELSSKTSSEEEINRPFLYIASELLEDAQE